MKVLRLFIEILLLGAVLFCVAVFFEKEYKNYWTHCDAVFYNNDKGLDSATIVYVGNSHTQTLYDYYPDSTQKAKNFSYAGLDLFEEYALLKSYAPRMKRLQRIFVSVDGEALGYNMSYFGQDYVVRQLYRFSDTLYRNTFVDRLMAKSNFFRSNRDILFLFSNRKYVMGNTDLKGIPGLNALPIELNNHKGDAVCKARAVEMTSLRFNKQLIKENINILQQIINLARKYHASLTVFNTPKTSCFVSYSNAGNVELSRRKIDSVLTANHLKYFDYYNDTSFSENDFVNSDHLSTIGLKKLMNKIVRQ